MTRIAPDKFKKEMKMKRIFFVFLALTVLTQPSALLAAEPVSYSAIDGVQFNDPLVSCEELHNEDDCHIWRAANNFDDRWTDYDPCGSFEDTQMITADQERQKSPVEFYREQVVAVKPAAGGLVQ